VTAPSHLRQDKKHTKEATSLWPGMCLSGTRSGDDRVLEGKAQVCLEATLESKYC
jgi:hypothetical protein